MASRLQRHYTKRLNALKRAGAFDHEVDFTTLRSEVVGAVQCFEDARELLGDHQDEYDGLRPEYVLCRMLRHDFPVLEFVGLNVKGGYGLTYFGVCHRCGTKVWRYKIRRERDGRSVLMSNGSSNYDHPDDYYVGVHLSMSDVVSLEALDSIDVYLRKLEQAHGLGS